ncbi:MAG: hypothetical protein U0T07_10410 [Chitinophagales bacterium]
MANKEELSDFNKKLLKAIGSSTEDAKGSTPRISVNKLAEYMDANATRRRKIVFDAKYPQKFIVTRYKEARDTIKQCLENGYGEDFVLNVIEELEDKECDTEFQKQDVALSIEALELFLDTDISSLSDFNFTPTFGNELLNISNVDISVNPDLIVSKEISGKKNIGAIKLHLSKNNTLSEESQKIVGAIIYTYTQDFLLKRRDVANPKLCISFDIFKQGIEICPSAYKMRMNRIEAACEEIALWWDRL